MVVGRATVLTTVSAACAGEAKSVASPKVTAMMRTRSSRSW
jgi:hypothetical protein